MKKKQYCTPSVDIHDIGVAAIICTSGYKVIKTDGNADIEYGGGSNELARARKHSVWDDLNE